MSTTADGGFRVAEGVGVGGPDHPPAPALVAEQVAAALADPGDAMLPGQHAGPLQRLDGLRHRAAGTAALRGDRLVARKAAAGAGVWNTHSRAPRTSRAARPRAPPRLARLTVQAVPGAGVAAMRALALRSSGTARPGPNTFSRRVRSLMAEPAAAGAGGRRWTVPAPRLLERNPA